MAGESGSGRPVRLWGVEIVGAWVCLGAAWVGAYYGALSMRLHDPTDGWAHSDPFYAFPPLGIDATPNVGLYSLGGVWGGAGGLIAGIVWTYLMAGQIAGSCGQDGRPTKRVSRFGLAFGVLVGGSCGVFVHLVLMIAHADFPNPISLVVGGVYGLWVGLWVGWFFGAVVRSAAGQTMQAGRPLALGRWWAWTPVALMAGLCTWAWATT